MNHKRYLIVTRWGYPFGGGEAYMHQTLSWARTLGMTCMWLFFTDSKNRGNLKLKIEEKDGAVLICPPGGFSVASLKLWLKLLRPDIVHHQGHNRKEILCACEELNVPVFTGYHFWLGLLKAEPASREFADILENELFFKKDPEIEELARFPSYVVSQYMANVCTKFLNLSFPILFPTTPLERVQKEYDDPIKSKYVVMINIHKNKGGGLLLELLDLLPELPFMVVRTEHESSDLDSLILEKIMTHPTDSFCLERLEDMSRVYGVARVLLVPSMVDETFCRVAVEGLLCGIPTLTSGKGNLSLLKNSVIVKDLSPQVWAKEIQKIYNSENYAELSAQTKMGALPLLEAAQPQFSSFLQKNLNSNVMLFVPWGDQGLGIQARVYVEILHLKGFQTFIFSYASYYSSQKNKFQKNEKEWAHPNVYYSPNTREKVTDEEFLQFIAKYKITKVILPETCWFRVFELGELCASENIKCYAIPNIEIVRASEVESHRVFYKVLANNTLCHNFFASRGFDNCEKIGFHWSPPSHVFKKVRHRKPATAFAQSLRFLCLGGMNAFTRKQVEQVCEAFVLARKSSSHIFLTVTVQGTLLPESFSRKFSSISSGLEIITKHLSYEEVCSLYLETDICIQVSRHEGLGLGFFEALALGVPVLTLNTAPHNEIVTDDLGWKIPCTYEPIKENNDAVMEAAIFQLKDLSDKLLHLAEHPLEVEEISNKVLASAALFSTKKHSFAQTFAEALD